MLTDDIRLNRIESEYQTVRGTQDQLMDRMNGFGDILQQLVDQVAANAAAIEANRQGIEANREAIEAIREEVLANRRAIAENSQMLSDIMDHLQVPRRRTGLLAKTSVRYSPDASNPSARTLSRKRSTFPSLTSS